MIKTKAQLQLLSLSLSITYSQSQPTPRPRYLIVIEYIDNYFFISIITRFQVHYCAMNYNYIQPAKGFRRPLVIDDVIDGSALL